MTTYAVRRSDTLWSISRIFATTPDRIRALNNLRSDTIYPGQRLKVPASSKEARGER